MYPELIQRSGAWGEIRNTATSNPIIPPQMKAMPDKATVH
jgi:hypothetical protein